MHVRLYTNLKNLKGKRFYLHPAPLLKDRRQLKKFLDGEDYFRTDSFVRMALFGEEIHANNQVEGYSDDLELIERAIQNVSSIKNSEQKQCALNLYKAHQFILKGEDINKETLKKLYSITSRGVLDEFSMNHMGEHYRMRDVYIVQEREEPFLSKGIPCERLDEFLEAYFEFLHGDVADNETDEYIKSQILHFYFVYIHPYFDANRRTSRTLAMWYLLNKKCYPYIIFHRGIAFNRPQYASTIRKAFKTRDMTHFLKLMLETLQVELEKEYIAHRASMQANGTLDSKDFQTLHYFLSLYGRKTLNDLTYLYNSQNEYKSPDEIYETLIVPLLDKGVLDVIYERPSSSTKPGDKVLTFRPLQVDPKKTKHLQL